MTTNTQDNTIEQLDESSLTVNQPQIPLLKRKKSNIDDMFSDLVSTSKEDKQLSELDIDAAFSDLEFQEEKIAPIIEDVVAKDCINLLKEEEKVVANQEEVIKLGSMTYSSQPSSDNNQVILGTITTITTEVSVYTESGVKTSKTVKVIDNTKTTSQLQPARVTSKFVLESIKNSKTRGLSITEILSLMNLASSHSARVSTTKIVNKLIQSKEVTRTTESTGPKNTLSYRYFSV